MEQASKKPSIGDARDIFGKDRNAWKILPLNGLYHPSTDASLFSSSLPVLPHENLNHGSSESAGDTVDSSDKIEGIEPIGSLLPGDEEELLAGIMDDFDLNELPTHLEDLDDDIFGSGGGLEMESEAQESVLNGFSHLGLSDSILGNNTGQYGFPNGVGTVAGEHPYGEHPSRTLFVRNINSNVEDSELKSIFEQYGDIRTLYTACKHRGFVMISYYDIRAARTAIRALQNKPLRRRRLDIHFSIPKDNPSEKDVNQGTLVVFNLDASVSNDDLRQIFGAYGEIKEIRETPNKRHHKFIEFYDVRAADAALKALNRCDIAGKRIKLEPSRPGGARRNLMQQLTQELEHDEARGFRHQVGSPLPSSPPGYWPTFSSPIEQHSLHGLSQSPGLGTFNPATRHQVGSLPPNSPPGCWPTFGSPIEQHSLHGLSQSPGMGTINPVTSNHLAGLASVLPNHLSTSGKFAPIGKEPGRMLGSSPVPVSPLGDLMSKSPTTGRLSGSQFLWGSPTVQSENASSSSWSTSTMGHPFAPSRQVQSPVVSSRQPSLLGSHHHVGSAPSGVPLDRQFGFLHESPETSYMSQVAFGNAGLSPTNGNHAMNIAPMNFGVAFAGNFAESGSPSRVMSLARNGPILCGNGSYGGLGSANLEAFNRNRRVENGNQVDNKKQYQLDLEKIRSGEDIRTTLMIKNIPNKYTSKMLLAAIDESHQGTYDFLYLPIDFKNKCNVGYAFINMVSPSHIVSFYEVFNGKKWEKFNSEKVASLAYARIQGRNALVAHFQNSSLMNEDKRCRPILFQSEGEGLTDQELFHSSNLNICIRQPDGSYSGDSLESPKGYFDEKLENTSTSF